MTAADESRVVWRHEATAVGLALGAAYLEGMAAARSDPPAEGLTYWRCPMCEGTGNVATKAARSEPRAEGLHRPTFLDDVPTGWCECGSPYPHMPDAATPPAPGLAAVAIMMPGKGNSTKVGSVHPLFAATPSAEGLRERLLIRDEQDPHGIIRDLTDAEWAALAALAARSEPQMSAAEEAEWRATREPYGNPLVRSEPRADPEQPE